MMTPEPHTKLREVVVYDFDTHSMSNHCLLALEAIASQVTVVKTPDDFTGMLDKVDLRNAEALITRVFDNFGFLAHRAPRLRYVGTCHTDTSHFPLEELKTLGVTVTNVPGYAAASVAELTLGVLLSLNRHIPAAFEHVAQGGWDVQRFMGRELGGRTIGIVGPGAIGGRIAKATQALGMNVVTHSRTARPDADYPQLPIDELLSSSDVVVLSVPLTSSTCGLLSRERIRLLRPDAILLVPARSETVDCSALLERCRSGELTVWFDELQDAEWREAYRSLPNVFLTPDYGWLTREALNRQESLAIGNILKWHEAESNRTHHPATDPTTLSRQE